MLTVIFSNPKTNDELMTLKMESCDLQRGDIILLPESGEPLVVVQRAIIFEKPKLDITNLTEITSARQLNVTMQVAVLPEADAYAR